MGHKPDMNKSQLVLEICSLSTRSIACAHRHPSTSVNSSPFIDWYRILGVEENAGIDVIRKRYHKLALQLHPDKNKHPKAEVAFKLVLEAYLCLSDNVRRKAFNLERWKNFCTECNGIPFTPCNSLRNSRATKCADWDRENCSRSYQVFLQSLKDVRERLADIRERFKEEVKVMEKCLKANAAASRKESPVFQPSECMFRSRSRKESSVFNPSDYRFDGYPHIRNQTFKIPENLCYLQRRKHDTPIFESRSDRGMFKSKSPCVHS